MLLKTSLLKLLAWSLIAIAMLALTGYLALRWYMGVLLPPLDIVAPSIPESLPRPAVLVFHKANGFVHEEAIPAGNRMLEELAATNGWSIYHTDNGAVMSPEQLQRFDVVVWNNTSGTTLNEQQRTAFRTWLESGGGFVGIHGAGGDIWYQWDWYVDTLLGAQFIGHTLSPQFQDAEILRGTVSELTTHLPSPWRVEDEEWYAFDRDVGKSGSEVLLVLDENSYRPGRARMTGQHPIAWRHEVGKGRAFYTAIGHQGKTFDNPHFRRLLELAISWAGGFTGSLNTAMDTDG